jgi:hypothetical protein
MLLDDISIPCPSCHGVSHKAIAWVATNVRFACDHCEEAVAIDHHRLTEALRDMEDPAAWC